MSSIRKRPIRPKRMPTGTYEVGYCLTPERGKFRPGQSGNPKGRPPGSKNRLPAEVDGFRWRSIVTREAERMITLQTRGGARKIPTAEAVMRSITVNALKGQQRSQRLFAELVAEEEREHRKERQETFVRWAEYKQTFENAQLRSTQLPNPNDINLDFATGEVAFAGPMIRAEVPRWTRWRAVRSLIVKELERLKGWQSKQASLHFDNEAVGRLIHLIAIAEEALGCIDVALNGSRAAMAVLEGLPIPEVDFSLRAS
jgi:hypothetical protein